MEKTRVSATDGKSRADPGSCCLDPSALWHKCHPACGTWGPWNATREKPQPAQKRRCVVDVRRRIFGWLFHFFPRSSEHFSSTASPEPVTAWYHWGHPKCPVPIPTQAPSPVPPRAELLFPPDPPQVLKIAAGALTHNSQPPPEPAAAPGAGSAMSPSVPPLDGHKGLAAAPCTPCPA